MSCSSQINYWVRKFYHFLYTKTTWNSLLKNLYICTSVLGYFGKQCKGDDVQSFMQKYAVNITKCMQNDSQYIFAYFTFFFQKVPLSQHNTVHIFETKNTGLLHAVNLHSAYVLTHFVAWEAIICDACVHCTSFKASFGWIDEFKSTQKSKRFFWKELINESLILITSMTSHQISRLYYKKVERIAKLDNWFHGIELLVHHTQMTNGKLINLVINIFQTCWLPMHYAHYSPWH